MLLAADFWCHLLHSVNPVIFRNVYNIHSHKTSRNRAMCHLKTGIDCFRDNINNHFSRSDSVWLTILTHFFARFSVTRTGSWVNLESSFQLENGCILICKMCLIESHYHFLSAQTPERAPFGHNSAKVIRANLKRKCWFICFINDIYPHFFGRILNQLKYYKENVHSAKKKSFICLCQHHFNESE